MAEGKINQISQGQAYSKSVTFSEADLDCFSDFIDDHAEFHTDSDCARRAGYESRILHGMLAASPFSGILGQQLPGEGSVINSINFKFVAPIYPEMRVDYKVVVEAISHSVSAVTLKLEAFDEASRLLITGKAMCSFPKIA